MEINEEEDHDKSANDLKIEITNISKFNHNKNDKSLILNANLSDIMKGPDYSNKHVVNYYEHESEDLSILKDIMSKRSNNQKMMDISQMSNK